MKLKGWIFFNLDSSNLAFVADEVELTQPLPWKDLLDPVLFADFRKQFKPVPTKEGTLPGWRIECDIDDLHRWFYSGRRDRRNTGTHRPFQFQEKSESA